jgi:hypothetical protein
MHHLDRGGLSRTFEQKAPVNASLSWDVIVELTCIQQGGWEQPKRLAAMVGYMLLLNTSEVRPDEISWAG